MSDTAIRLTAAQLRLLQIIFSKGAEDASRSLSKWLRSGVRLNIDEVSQVTLAEATAVLGPVDQVVAACLMTLSGRFTGKLILAFEEAAGLALVDMLLGRPLGTCRAWGELEISAANETANILGCAYLNSLAAHLPEGEETETGRLVPSPPEFAEDYAASLLQFALLEQAAVSDQVLLIRTQFMRDQTHLSWHLLLVPDPASFARIATTLLQPKEGT